MARRDDRTLDLLNWEPPEVAVGYEPGVAGRGSMDSQIARLLSRALRDARDDRGLTRTEVAASMSLDLHRTITEDQLDKWCSEAATTHRIPLDAFTALVKVTEAEDLLGFIPALLGFVVVPKKYAAIIELHLVEEKERDLAAHKVALQARVRGR